MVTKTQEEWDAMGPEERKAHLKSEQTTVFGIGHKVVKGQPVEQGIGAPGRETENHFRAIGKYEGADAEKAARAAAAARRKASKAA